MMIKPLQGQCLVELLPADEAINGIVIPDGARLTLKLPPLKGIVRRMGKWPQKKNGYAVLPEFAPGDTVLVSQYGGQKLRAMDDRFRLVKIDDVLAKISC